MGFFHLQSSVTANSSAQPKWPSSIRATGTTCSTGFGLSSSAFGFNLCFDGWDFPSFTGFRCSPTASCFCPTVVRRCSLFLAVSRLFSLINRTRNSSLLVDPRRSRSLLRRRQDACELPIAFLAHLLTKTSLIPLTILWVIRGWLKC